jgi:hypothetical protein
VSFIKIKRKSGEDKSEVDVCVEDRQGLLKKLFKKRC